jgi:Ca-activated chloride channel homolog
MTFETPLVLVALVLVPAAAVLYAIRERRARRGRAQLVPEPLLPSVLPRRERWRRHAPVVLVLGAAAGLVVALARPQTSEAVPVEQATVVVATDRSGSMLAQDVSPSRLLAARRAAGAFLDAVPDDVRVGAIAFNHEPTVLATPTRDHAAVKAALQRVEAAGSTATGDALDAGLRLVEQARTAGAREAPPAAIVLLSDGKSVRGRDVLEVARRAKAAGVPVYTVALGTAAGTITGDDGVTRDVPPDPQTLRQVAETTGGEAFAIEDASELERIYDRLGSELATEERPVEQTGLVAGGALLLLLAGAGVGLRTTGRLL